GAAAGVGVAGARGPSAHGGSGGGRKTAGGPPGPSVPGVGAGASAWAESSGGGVGAACCAAANAAQPAGPAPGRPAPVIVNRFLIARPPLRRRALSALPPPRGRAAGARWSFVLEVGTIAEAPDRSRQLRVRQSNLAREKQRVRQRLAFQ